MFHLQHKSCVNLSGSLEPQTKKKYRFDITEAFYLAQCLLYIYKEAMRFYESAGINIRGPSLTPF